jgi:amicoumacin kinase
MIMKLHFSNDELYKAAHCWNAIPLQPVKGSNHFFYEVLIHDSSCIMRLTDTNYRDLPAVLAETHWIGFLTGKAPVARVIPSLDNQDAVPLKIGGRSIIASVFEKITGQRLREGEAWGEKVFREWGRTLASLHALSKQYTPGMHQHRQLDGALLLALAEKLEGKNSLAFTILQEKWKAIQNNIPVKDWGITHCDLTRANMRFRNNLLYLFDFDNCQYAPFLYDMAVTVYVTLFGMWRKPGFEKEAGVFLRNFLAGYTVRSVTTINIPVLRSLLEFFNALVYLSCRQCAHHPFMEYASYNLEHGTLHDAGLENFFELNDKKNTGHD